MTVELPPQPGGFDKQHDRAPDTPAGEVAWGEWVYSQDRAVRACLTRSTHDEHYLFVQGETEYRGLYGTAHEPTVMLWFDVASWSDHASYYSLMSPQEEEYYLSVALDDDEDEDAETGEPTQPPEEPDGEPWTPPDWVFFGGEMPDHMTHLTPEDVDGARRYRLLAHFVWRFSAEAAKSSVLDEKALFGDLPWVKWTPSRLDDPIIFRRGPAPFEVEPADEA